MPKRKTDAVSIDPKDALASFLFFFFPLFLVLGLALSGGALAAVLPPLPPSWAAGLADLVLALALLNGALAAVFVPSGPASFRWYGLFLLLGAVLAGLEGALDLAAVFLFSAWMGAVLLGGKKEAL